MYFCIFLRLMRHSATQLVGRLGDDWLAEICKECEIYCVHEAIKVIHVQSHYRDGSGTGNSATSGFCHLLPE